MKYLFGLLAGAALTCAATSAPYPHAKRIQADDGHTTTVEAGKLLVPESRDPSSRRQLTIPWYRLKSTSPHPATPIFLLAGGPGASWLDLIEHAENFREVMFYRSIADVVLFDQRGGGHALPAMHCLQSTPLRVDRPLDMDQVRDNLRRMVRACRDHWLAAGVDLAAYNTQANAEDLDDLRRALGYRRITLIGGSYGSHLALAYLRKHPRSVDRMVLYGMEGPNQTWDDPAGVLASLARIAQDAQQSPALVRDLPEGGLLASLQRTLDRLHAHPVAVALPDQGNPATVVVDDDWVRLMLRRDAGRRSHPNAWPDWIMTMARGNYLQVARFALAHRTLRLQDPMHYMMDCSAGISPSRRQRYEASPARRLLGDVNQEYADLCDLWPVDPDKHDPTPVHAKVPALIFQGTWDTSTPLENAREVAATLPNARVVEVVGGTHGALYNLYAHWPPMWARMRAYLSATTDDFPSRIELPPLSYRRFGTKP
ncbi:alpha/beta fold hydrolase [Frateuria sp. GZRR35]|uniref:alpha/beta fold hydrolase n=1 Tax=unclassified Frateuria TaxID=2648894 RepID=UPI003EDC8EE8